MDTENQIRKLEGILKILDTDRASTEEVAVALEMVLSIVEKVKSDLEQEMAQNKGEMENECREMMSEMDEKEERLKKIIAKLSEKQAVDKTELMQYCKTEIGNLQEMIPVIPDLTPLEKKIGEVEAKIPPKTDLTKIEGNISGIYEEIDEIKKEIKELKGRRTAPIFGGGFNYSAMNIHILDPYVPTGTINGINTDFALKGQPSPATSLKVWLNGQKQKLTSDYTVSGSVVTFLVAPPTDSIIEVEHRI